MIASTTEKNLTPSMIFSNVLRTSSWLLTPNTPGCLAYLTANLSKSCCRLLSFTVNDPNRSFTVVALRSDGGTVWMKRWYCSCGETYFTDDTSGSEFSFCDRASVCAAEVAEPVHGGALSAVHRYTDTLSRPS
jgi:hypothetical protein